MLLRLSTSATTVALCLMFLTSASPFTIASNVHDDSSKNNLTQLELSCLPFGTCEPCPEDALQEPFCRPFGNRRLVHCINATSSMNVTQSGPSHAGNGHGNRGSLDHKNPEHPEGETIAWESCGRIPSQERADFYEFVACNILFAALSLVVLFARSKRLQAIQARQLAARIGLIRR